MAKRVGKYKISKRDSGLHSGGPLVLTGVVEGSGATLSSNQIYYTSSQYVASGSEDLKVLIRG